MSFWPDLNARLPVYCVLMTTKEFQYRPMGPLRRRLERSPYPSVASRHSALPWLALALCGSPPAAMQFWQRVGKGGPGRELKRCVRRGGSDERRGNEIAHKKARLWMNHSQGSDDPYGCSLLWGGRREPKKMGMRRRGEISFTQFFLPNTSFFSFFFLSFKTQPWLKREVNQDTRKFWRLRWITICVVLAFLFARSAFSPQCGCFRHFLYLRAKKL